MKPVSHSNSQVPLWKRTFDLCALLLLLPLILFFGLLITLLIRLMSSGPVLFRQERVGHLGKKFMLFKFRTMYVGSNPDIHRGHLEELLATNKPMTKMDSHGDRRIIPFGVVLRSSGLDELPQLINVFRGEMSLVGPRPCMPYEQKRYLHWQKERFDCLPGLTGLWQVSGKNNTTFLEMIQMDIEYSRKKTLWLDLAIISKTIPALLVQMWEIRQHRIHPTVPEQQEPVESVRSISE
jgi:lipopolysaccharide/colanic/teichoic acid biosynthesis glycosyltransferase